MVGRPIWCVSGERLCAPRLYGLEISRTTRMAKTRNRVHGVFVDELLDLLVVGDVVSYVRQTHIW